MKTGTVILTTLLLLLPVGRAEGGAQTIDCRKCESEWYYDPMEPENSFKAHHFDSVGEDRRECERVPEESLEEELPIRGPVLRREGCASCHNDWVYGSDCYDPPHAPCWPGGGTSWVELIAEVDRVVSSMGDQVGSKEQGRSAADLMVWLERTGAFALDRQLGLLSLADCRGNVLARWSLPHSFLRGWAGFP